jgi:hypothetical protein
MGDFMTQNSMRCIALILISLFCPPAESAWAANLNKCWGISSYGPVVDGPLVNGIPSVRMLPMPDLTTGEVVGVGPSFFLWAMDSTCSADPKKCRPPNQPYLVARDPVVITASIPGYLCVTYAKKAQRYYTGWMPTNRVDIDPVAASAIPLSSWVGTWRDGSTTIILSRRGHQLLVYGDAVWQGLSDPHFGEINAVGTPEGNTLTLGTSDQPVGCYVKLLRTRNLLVAVDNGGCGGANVTFSGFYIRK